MRSPASRASFSIRFSRFDLTCAVAAPWLALWVRGAPSLQSDITAAIVYCLIALAASAVAFLVFRIRDGLTHLFSVQDALEVAKAVLLADALSCLVLFSATRLEGIPRSTPVVHALILGAALISGRAFMRMFYKEQQLRDSQSDAIEHVFIIGSNRLAAMYIGFLRAYRGDRIQVAGLLDDRPTMLGRSVAGVRVLGPTAHLEQLMREFLEHGIRADRVLVAADATELGAEACRELTAACLKQNAELQFIPELLGLDTIAPTRANNEREAAVEAAEAPVTRGYFTVKRYIDFCFALIMIVLAAPLFALTAFLVLVDMGSPAFFWQLRQGLNGRPFQLHKFRTLKPSFDSTAMPIPSGSRISRIGAFLRRHRLDELPQLLNVLVGDMSLVGPRPLLAEDQPANPAIRLSVRPGITGWAQIHGGKLLDAETKNKFDEWYVRNASFWLDLKIVFLTLLALLRSENQELDFASIVLRHAPDTTEARPNDNERASRLTRTY